MKKREYTPMTSEQLERKLNYICDWNVILTDMEDGSKTFSFSTTMRGGMPYSFEISAFELGDLNDGIAEIRQCFDADVCAMDLYEKRGQDSRIPSDVKSIVENAEQVGKMLDKLSAEVNNFYYEHDTIDFSEIKSEHALATEKKQIKKEDIVR